MRLGAEPTVSVVIASTAGRPALEALLARVLEAGDGGAIEVVVARACPVDEFRALSAAWPKVLFMPAPDGAGVPELRMAGLSAADGDIVRLIEDAQVVGDEWIAALAGPNVGDPT
jgi:hypothetical protein